MITPKTQMAKRGLGGVATFLVLFTLLSVPVHAGVGDFVGNLIPDSITKSFQSMQVILSDFLALVLDLFTILLFIFWIALIASIIYGIIYVIQLPRKLGVKNFHDAMIIISSRLWEFMKL